MTAAGGGVGLKIGAGALAALLWAWLAAGIEGRARAPGAPHLWAVDRDAGEVLALDQDAWVVRRWGVPWPLEVAVATDGAVWVLASRGPGPLAARRLLRFDDSGRQIYGREFDHAEALHAIPGGSIGLLIGTGAARELIDLDASGEETRRSPAAHAQNCWARGSDRLLGGGGRLWRASTGTELDLGGGTHVAVATRSTGWWVVVRRPEGLHCLHFDESLALEGSVSLHRLAPDRALRGEALRAGADAFWVVPRAGAPWHVYPSGAAHSRSAWQPIAVTAAIEAPAGGLWLASPGALVRLDARGSPGPGQGGFAHLQDISPAAGPPWRLAE